jgi:tetratricopeptide (TPR) repeat protein
MLITSSDGILALPNKQSIYKYHVALSFAGEDRSKVAPIARDLKRQHLDVFYDADYRAELWGKGQTEFERIYGGESLFVVPFLSESYKKKPWTQTEFAIAKRERKNRDYEYLLPVVVDDGIYHGVSDDIIYLSIDGCTRKEIVDCIVSKCRSISEPRSTPKASSAKPQATSAITLLDQQTRTVLCLIATAAVPLTSETLKRVFPEVRWKQHSQKLIEAKLVRVDHERLLPSAGVVAHLKSNSSEWEDWNSRWLNALEPFKHHIDLCLSVSLHHLSGGRIDDAVEILTDAIEWGDLGFWNRIYQNALLAFISSKSKLKLKPEVRLQALNGIGLCLLHSGVPAEAVVWFNRLRARSKRCRNDHWLGQAYLNLGIAFASQSQEVKAAEWYRKAEQHGYATKDSVLVGRALGNLSQIISDTNVVAAQELLKTSMKLKRETGDKHGLAVGKAQLARLFHLSGNQYEAIKAYRKAIELLETCGLFDNSILAHIHLGNVLAAIGQKSNSRTEYQRAIDSAEEYGINSLLKVALSLKAQVCQSLNDWPGLKEASERIISVAKETKDSEHLICGLHSKGVFLRLQGDDLEGRKLLLNAQKRAARDGNRHWFQRCCIDRLRTLEKKQLCSPNWNKVKTAALQQERKNPLLAADLWKAMGDDLFSEGTINAAMIGFYNRAIKCYEVSKQIEDAALLLAHLSDCYQHLHDYESSLASLASAQSLAKNNHKTPILGKILNHKAILLQELGRFEDAIKTHQHAVRIQRKLPDTFDLQVSLHNLGEALRKVEEYDDANSVFDESESLARSRNDADSTISTMHSKALVLHHMGDTIEASRLFLKCRNEAKKLKLWHEYVRAWVAMANLAWSQGKTHVSIKRYRKAATEAKKYHVENDEDFLGLSVNLANALYWTGKGRQALRILEPLEQRFVLLVTSYIYHAALADIYEACKLLDKASLQWQKGLDASIAAGNREYIAYCACSQGMLYQQSGQHDLAAKSFGLSLEYENDNEARITLLSELLDCFLATGQDELAGSVFTEATDLARAQGNYEKVIDIHMSVFDSHWPRGDEEKLEALKAMSVAVIEAMQYSETEVMVDILCHAVAKLTDPAYALNATQVDKLQIKLREWLTEQLYGDNWLVQFILAHLDIARELLPLTKSPRTLARRSKSVFDKYHTMLFNGVK